MVWRTWSKTPRSWCKWVPLKMVPNTMLETFDQCLFQEPKLDLHLCHKKGIYFIVIVYSRVSFQKKIFYHPEDGPKTDISGWPSVPLSSSSKVLKTLSPSALPRQSTQTPPRSSEELPPLQSALSTPPGRRRRRHLTSSPFVSCSKCGGWLIIPRPKGWTWRV